MAHQNMMSWGPTHAGSLQPTGSVGDCGTMMSETIAHVSEAAALTYTVDKQVIRPTEIKAIKLIMFSWYV